MMLIRCFFSRAVTTRFALLLLLVAQAAPLVAQESPATNSPERKVILVTIDGLRWQEVFRGAEERLISKEAGGVKDVEKIRADFWRETAEQRREALMPFFWKTIVPQGQVFGNRDRQSLARVKNDQHFSYPGYSEILCGFPDARITSNDKIPNPNITVLEWISRRPSFAGRVAAFCSWDVFPYILNVDRSHLPVNAGWTSFDNAADSPKLATANEMMEYLPRVWDGVRYDAFTHLAAREYLQRKQPRLLFVSLGEPDDWAHEGRYDLYLTSTRMCDRMIAELWALTQSMPEYRGNTSLVLVVDHGRGRVGDEWKNHSVKLAGSDEIWMAVMGPDTPALGERVGLEVTQSQIASTVAGLLGEDYRAVVPEADPALPVIAK